MGLSLKNIGKKITDFASRGYDQINTADNGRTWSQRTPTNNRSVIGQATHNGVTNTIGNVFAKPIANTIAGTIIEPARSVVADFTGNKQAGIAAEARKFSALDSSIPGFIMNSAKNVFDIPVQIGTDIAVDTFGSPEAKMIRDGQTMQAINKTPFGLVSSPIQHNLAGNQVIRDNPTLTPQQQLELKKQNLARVGLDPGASLGKQSLESVLAGLELYGTAKAPEIAQNPAGFITDQLDMLNNGVSLVKNAPNKAAVKWKEETALPPTKNLTDNELGVLGDYADAKMGTNKAKGQELNNLHVHARQIAEKAGIDVITGSPVEINNRIGKFLEDYNFSKNAKPQGGYVRIGKDAPDAPQVGKQDPLEALKAEARKYKSAEEFVANNRKNIGVLKNAGITNSQEARNFWAQARNEGDATHYLNPQASTKTLTSIVQPKSDLWRQWFHNADHKALPAIESEIRNNPELKDAGVSRLYDHYKQTTGDNISFNDFLNKDLKLYRGGNNRASNSMASFTQDINKAKRFGNITKLTIKPKDTYGMLGDLSEGEILVPSKNLTDLYNQAHTQPTPKVEAPTVDPTEALKQEALKYKSAEEFVKAQGNTLYHGSTENIDNFDLNHLNQTYMHNGLGINFTDNKDFAKLYSRGKNQWGEINKTDNGKGFINERLTPGAKVLDLTKGDKKVGDVLSFNSYKQLATSSGVDSAFARKNLEHTARNLLTGKDDSSLVVTKRVAAMSNDELLKIKYDSIKDRALVSGYGLPDMFRAITDVSGMSTEQVANAVKQFSKITDSDIIKSVKEDGTIVYTVLNPDVLKTKAQLTDLYNQATQSQPPKSPLTVEKNVAPNPEPLPVVKPKVELKASDQIKSAQKQTLESIAEKPKVSIKESKVANVDPTDPFGNRGIIKKIRNEVGSLVDDDASMIRLLKKIEKETGRKGLVDQWYVDTNEVKLSTTRANAKTLDSQNMRDAYRGMSAKELKEFDKYSVARRELSYDEKMATSMSRSELARIKAEGDAKYGARFDARKRATDQLTDELYSNGIITKEVADSFRKNQDYTRIQRDMEDLLGVHTSQSKSRSFASTSTNQKVTGSKREALSAAATDLQRRQQLEREIQRNKAASHTIDTLEGVGLAKPLINADDVSARRQAYKTMKELKPVRDAVKKEADATAKIAKELTDRNKKLGPDILTRMEGAAPDVRKRAVSLANDGKRAVNKPTSKRLAKPPTSADFQEAFEQYLDGDPKLVKNMYEFMGNKAEINRVQNKLDGLKAQYDQVKADRSDLWLDAKRHSDKITTNKNTVSRFRNGIKEVYEVHPDIKKVVDNVSPYQLGILSRVISSPVRVMRAGATGLNAAFAGVNYMRDQITSAILSKDVVATHNPVSVISGLYNSDKGTFGENNSEAWKKFTEFAGDTTVYDDLRNAKSSRRVLRELRYGTKGKLANMATSPLRSVEDVISITEKATRFQNFRGMYKKAIKEGLSEGEAYQKAYLAAAQNSVDFNRNSNFTRTMNTVFPYFNASMQGTRSMVRAFKERPIQTSAKSLAFVGLPAMAAVAHNLSTAEGRAAWDSINDYEKEDNFIIIMPGAHQTDSGTWEGVIKIPKPQGFRELTQPLQDVTEAFIKKQPNPDSAMQIAQKVLEGLTGPINIGNMGELEGSFVPQVAKPFVQQALNSDLYSGKKIVPDYMKEGSDNPADWKYESTSGSAQLAGKVINRSPLQVEKFVKDVFGSVGSYGINAADNAIAWAKGDNKLTAKNESDFTIGGRSPIGEIKRRTVQASGELLDENKTPGQKYYETVDKALKDASLDKNETSAWNTLHPAKKNFMGEEIFDENKRLSNYTRASIYLQYPKVFIADARIDAMQRAQGKLGNPLYDLPKDQLTRVLLKATLPPGAKDPELSNLYKEEWYQDYNTKRDAYYAGVKSDLAKQGKEMPKSDNPYPEAQESLQSAMDQYSALPKGTGARSAWIRANGGKWQEMVNHWSAVDAWENKERVGMGLSPIDNTVSANGSSSSGYGGSNRDSTYGTSNLSRYAISRNAGGAIAKPTVTVRANKSSSKKKYTVSKPTVSLKKSMV
jgi:hypothetical protein